MSLIKFMGAVLTVCLINACASSPEEIKTTHVSASKYTDYDCEKIATELGDVGRQVNELYYDLKEEADADAAQMSVGLILFWPSLFFLEGGDDERAGEYARLKGEKLALEDAAKIKQCDPAMLPVYEDPIQLEKERREKMEAEKVDIKL